MEIITENGVVSEIIGDLIKIQIPKKPDCEECRSIFCSKSEGNSNFIEIENKENFKIGEKVEIQLEGKYLIKATLLLFVLPLIILVSTISLLFFLQSNASLAAVISFSLVAIYYVILKQTKTINIRPRIVRKL